MPPFRAPIPLRLLALLLALLPFACARSVPEPRPPAAEVATARPEPAVPEPAAPEAAPMPEEPAPPPVRAQKHEEPAVVSPAAVSVPATLRVGLATDLGSVTLPCCEPGVSVVAAGRELAAVPVLRIEPAVEGVAAGAWRLQVAALKDERQSGQLAEKLAAMLEAEADSVFDAGTGLYRVRVGRYPTRQAAEQAQGLLAMAGVGSTWVVSEAPPLTDPAFRLVQGGRQLRVPGRWLQVRAEGDGGIRLEQGRFRGRILVFLNNRGTLNLINEVGLEDYLRGVVPREMGPRIYDQLEALKAQAVAARTYTVRNLGEFLSEGYDICATPRCQVYGGMDIEDPLTDQAVLETAGEVLLADGGPIDALYSSTCGGHTEDVEVVFPLKQASYLRGVPCLEAGVTSLAGKAAGGASLPETLMARLLPAGAPELTPAVLAARLEHLARLAGLAVPRDRLESLERREVQRYLASVLDLAVDARLFVAREDLAYLLENPPSYWSEEDRLLAAYLRKSGLLEGALDQPLKRDEVEETLFRLALYLQVLEEREVRFLALEEGRLRVRRGGDEETLDLGDSPATFRDLGNEIRAADLALVPGDRMQLYLEDGRLVAAVHRVDSDGVAFDRTSNYSSWTRFRSDRELTGLVQQRYPAFPFRGLEVLARGRSGRVGALRLVGDEGAAVKVEGLAVRWTLDVPDTLFTVRRLEPPGRVPGWLFTGRGWGHGVGLCQVGAYGMALRGHGYLDILHHYYTGVEVVKGLPRAGTGGPGGDEPVSPPGM